MSRTIAIVNQKGGVGKTTTTVNLGASLAEQGWRVLLIDLDPQASLTASLQVGAAGVILPALQEAAAGKRAYVADCILRTKAGLDLIPSGIELSQAEIDLRRDRHGLLALRAALISVESHYDFVLLDCPPSLSVLTINGLAAAGEALIPLQTDYLALRGVELLISTVGKVRDNLNPSLAVLGIVLTMADARTLHSQEVIAAARESLGRDYRVFQTVIPNSVRLREAPLAGQSVLGYARASTAASAYRALAKEVLSVS